MGRSCGQDASRKIAKDSRDVKETAAVEAEGLCKDGLETIR